MSDTNCEAYYKKPNGIFKCMKKVIVLILILNIFLAQNAKIIVMAFIKSNLKKI